MGHHDYPYKKGVNITAWLLQIIVCLILLGASAWLLSVIDDEDVETILGEYDGLFTAAAGLQIALTGLTIVFDIVEMVLIGRKRMPPALYLASACIKTAIWGIIFVLNLIVVSVLSIILCGVLFATSLVQLVHGARIVHRKRKGGSYAPASNPAGNAEAGYGIATAHQNTEYKSQSPQPPAYDPAFQPQQPYGYGAPQQQQQQQQHQGANSYELDSRVH
ncbi:hypothetical protein F4775DRAFT_415945 [Biscogniauxia sp. FL1348]|nr:hypothetical protein F4775DRAFT_415945 [Biscogniauxia sp. FL1348]